MKHRFTPSDAISYAESHLSKGWQDVANNRASGFHEASSIADAANENGTTIGQEWANFIDMMESDA